MVFQLPIMSSEEALNKINNNEVIEGYFIENLELSGKISCKIHIKDCEIGIIHLENANLNECTFENVVFHKWVSGWKTPFSKTNSAVFANPVSFKKCIFKENSYFSGAEFFSVAYFQNVHFEKDVSFREVHFHEQVYFWKSIFQGKTDFKTCKFNSEGHFDDAEFMDTLSFDGIRLLKQELSLNKMIAKENVSFQGAQLQSIVVMRKAIIYGELDFKDAKISDLDCTDAKFHSKVSFKNAIWEGKASFLHTTFFDLASFLGTQFQEACFINSQFQSEVLFNYDKQTRVSLEEESIPAQFFKKADFTNVRFNKRAIFEKVTFHQPSAFVNSYFAEEANFIESEFKAPVSFNGMYCNQELNAMKAIFTELTLDYSNINHRLDLSDATFTDISFYKSFMDPMVVEKGQTIGRMTNERPLTKHYGFAKEEYLVLKESFQKRGMLDEEDWAYRKFRQMKRRASSVHAINTLRGKLGCRTFFRPLARLLWNTFEKIIIDKGCGYGTQPLNITLVAFLIIALFSGIYSCFPEGLNYPSEYSFGYSQAIYFSLSIFTTMGVENIHPKLDSIMRFVVSTEAFLGLFIMTLFVGTYTRKIIR